MPIFHDHGGLSGAARCALGWGVLAADTVLAGSAVSATSYLDEEGELAYKIGCQWCRFNLALMGAQVTTEGFDKLKSMSSCVVMANHQSHLDTWALAGALSGQFRWIMKQELRKIPFFGSACQRVGHIFVQRGKSESARRSMAQAAKRIANGTSVVFYPEGTRSMTGELGKFKTGGFRLAMQAGVDLLPVTISGTYDLLPPKTWRYRTGKIHLCAADPIPTKNRSPDNPADLAELMQLTRTAIEAGRQTLK